MRAPLRARVCAGCGKPKGAFSYLQPWDLKRGYWHLNCFNKAKKAAPAPPVRATKTEDQ